MRQIDARIAAADIQDIGPLLIKANGIQIKIYVLFLSFHCVYTRSEPLNPRHHLLGESRSENFLSRTDRT